MEFSLQEIAHYTNKTLNENNVIELNENEFLFKTENPFNPRYVPINRYKYNGREIDTDMVFNKYKLIWNKPSGIYAINDMIYANIYDDNTHTIVHVIAYDNNELLAPNNLINKHLIFKTLMSEYDIYLHTDNVKFGIQTSIPIMNIDYDRNDIIKIIGNDNKIYDYYSVQVEDYTGKRIRFNDFINNYKINDRTIINMISNIVKYYHNINNIYPEYRNNNLNIDNMYFAINNVDNEYFNINMRIDNYYLATLSSLQRNYLRNIGYDIDFIPSMYSDLWMIFYDLYKRLRTTIDEDTGLTEMFDYILPSEFRIDNKFFTLDMWNNYENRDNLTIENLENYISNIANIRGGNSNNNDSTKNSTKNSTNRKIVHDTYDDEIKNELNPEIELNNETLSYYDIDVYDVQEYDEDSVDEDRKKLDIGRKIHTNKKVLSIMDEIENDMDDIKTNNKIFDLDIDNDIDEEIDEEMNRDRNRDFEDNDDISIGVARDRNRELENNDDVSFRNSTNNKIDVDDDKIEVDDDKIDVVIDDNDSIVYRGTLNKNVNKNYSSAKNNKDKSVDMDSKVFIDDNKNNKYSSSRNINDLGLNNKQSSFGEVFDKLLNTNFTKKIMGEQYMNNLITNNDNKESTNRPIEPNNNINSNKRDIMRNLFMSTLNRK